MEPVPTPPRALSLSSGLWAVLLCVPLVSLPWIFQGLDLTDDGDHLTNQLELLTGNWMPRTDHAAFTWLSDVVGAVWLRVGGIGLLNARVGAVLLTTLTAITSYRALRRFFAPGPTAVSLIGATLMIHARGRVLIDYNAVPILFILAGVLLLFEPDGSGLTDRRRAVRSVLSGVFIGLAILSRIPSAPAIILPYVPPVLRWLLLKNRSGRPWRGALLSSAGTLVTFAAAASILAMGGSLQALLSALSGREVSEHSPHAVLGKYLSHAEMGLPLLAAILAMIATWEVTRRLAGERRSPLLVLPGFLAVALPILAVLHLSRWSFHFLEWRYPVLLISLPLGVTFWQAWNRPRRGQHERWYGELELLILGLAAALVAGFGTNNGLLKVPYGLWLALPAAFLVMLERIGSAGHRSVWLLFGIVVILGTALRMASPYRDYPDRRRLLTPVAHPRLAGIHTTATQARRVEGLMAELAKYAREGDTVLAVGSIPMVHFLSGTHPALGNPWPDPLPARVIRRRLEGLRASGSLPPVAVRARGAHAGRSLRLFNRWLAANGYEQVWSNGTFAILVPEAEVVPESTGGPAGSAD